MRVASEFVAKLYMNLYNIVLLSAVLLEVFVFLGKNLFCK